MLHHRFVFFVLLLLVTFGFSHNQNHLCFVNSERFIDKDSVLNIMVALGKIRPHESVVFDFGCVSCAHSLYFKSLNVYPPGHYLQQGASGGSMPSEDGDNNNVQTNRKGADRVVSIVSQDEEPSHKVQWMRDSLAFRRDLGDGSNEDPVRILQVRDYGNVEEIASIIEREQAEKPKVHQEPNEYETLAASRMKHEELREKMLGRHAKHHVPSVAFLRMRTKKEANALAPILFKHLKHGSRIVTLNHAFDKYQARNTFVVDNTNEKNEVEQNEKRDETQDEVEEDNDDDDHKELLDSTDSSSMPHPRAIFVYVVSHEKSSAIDHDIGRFAKFRISLSDEQILKREMSGAAIPVGELWYHRFLTSRNVFNDDKKVIDRQKKTNKKSSTKSHSEDELDEDEDDDEARGFYFHGVLSSPSIEEDPVGKFNHCLVTIGTKDGFLSFVKFQQNPTHQIKRTEEDFEFRLLRADTNEHLTGWVSNKMGGDTAFETFTIPRETLELHAPFDLAVEVKFVPISEKELENVEMDV